MVTFAPGLEEALRELGVLDKVIANVQRERADMSFCVKSLEGAFSWRDTPEGYNYWAGIYLKLIKR